MANTSRDCSLPKALTETDQSVGQYLKHKIEERGLDE